jgi:hypothetical protein
MWPFKNKIPTHSSFRVGDYKLDMSVNDFKDLVEFSAQEYSAIPREFKNGKNFNAPSANFLNREWQIQLGTVDNVIYKIAPYLLVKTKNEANPIAMQTLHFCTQELGQPSERKTGLFIWDTLDGNVVFQTGEAIDGWSINLFITSSNIRKHASLQE